MARSILTVCVQSLDRASSNYEACRKSECNLVVCLQTSSDDHCEAHMRNVHV